jgi:glycyl-tRNA synthetase beta chain
VIDSDHLLVEIGTEELPPKALRALATAFADGLCQRLTKSSLTFGQVDTFATPRRLALLIHQLAVRQPDQTSERRGPALAAAYDADGRPTPAATGFARSCGVALDAMTVIESAQGKWLACSLTRSGDRTEQLVPGLVAETLNELPIPRRMRWGTSDAEFVRPVRWLVLMLGEHVIPARILGHDAGRLTYGHRFHAPAAIALPHASAYPVLLRTQGMVIPDFDERRRTIADAVRQAAATVNARVTLPEALLDEVTALVEWPAILTGYFDAEFLALPAEVLTATMQGHQRYFPLTDDDGRLIARFITVANIDSPHPESIIAGNRRVIQPRLTDARFFWLQDQKQALAERLPQLANIVFEQRLGSLHDKTERVAALAVRIAASTGAASDLVRRAALLSRCDLVTGMVGEFPELQGIMGRYYARASGEPATVADAIEELYLPRHAGDRLPATPIGQALAIADRVDTVVGIFAIGKQPTGDKDPYALRRHALAVLRICIERGRDLDLQQLITFAADAYHGRVAAIADTAGARDALIAKVFQFCVDRLRTYYLEREIGADVFEAVKARNPTRPLDFDRRIRAVTEFRNLPAAQSLAIAHKRSANILAQHGAAGNGPFAHALLRDPAEQELAARLDVVGAGVEALLAAGDYTDALTQLATLRAPVDAFFDGVLVMCDDAALRRNRIALIARLHGLFTAVADISRLQS